MALFSKKKEESFMPQLSKKKRDSFDLVSKALDLVIVDNDVKKRIDSRKPEVEAFKAKVEENRRTISFNPEPTARSSRLS